jgi:hypothetical protein
MTYRPSPHKKGSLKGLVFFSEIVTFGEKHAVLEPRDIQLATNGKVVHP